MLLRTEAEGEVFSRALAVMGNLYGSLWATTVLRCKLVPKRPEGFSGNYNDTPYDVRGWTTFERFAAELASAHRLAIAHSRSAPSKLVDIGTGHRPQPAVLAEPPSTAEIVKQMGLTTFTNGKEDQAKCVRMLKTFAATLRAEANMSDLLGEGARDVAQAFATHRKAFDTNPRVQRVAQFFHSARVRLLRSLHRVALRLVPPLAASFIYRVSSRRTDRFFLAIDTISLHSRSATRRITGSLSGWSTPTSHSSPSRSQGSDRRPAKVAPCDAAESSSPRT